MPFKQLFEDPNHEPGSREMAGRKGIGGVEGQEENEKGRQSRVVMGEGVREG